MIVQWQNLNMIYYFTQQRENKRYIINLVAIWYKERLQTRYIKSKNPLDTSKFLIGKNWTFTKDGLDDFRDGLPPPQSDGDIIKGSKGLQPNIQGSSDDLSSIKQPAARQRFNKHEICFSRVTPLQQQRRDHIDEIEYGLTQHPLALYPHLEECLPADVFEDVVDILDPEMNLPDDDDEEQDDYFESESDSHSTLQHKTTTVSLETDKQTDEVKVRNPYRWLPKKEEKDKKDKKKSHEKRTTSPSEDEHIKGVTKEFCDWVASLGGESNNIEESTITSLFASGYETKPALSVPIHVVELTNVPSELRMSANVPQQQQKKPETTESEKKSEWTYSGQYKPSWLKFRYGAWYLSPKTWKKMKAEEPLQNPKELKDQEMSESKKKSHKLDTELAPMHGAQAFMKYIDGRGNRRPEFLNNVAEIQHKQAEEDLAKQEAELIKQRKLHGRRSPKH